MKERELFDTWKRLIDNTKKLQHTLLQMMGHPEVTPEQLMAAAKTYRELMQNIRENTPKVRAKLRWLHERHFDALMKDFYG
jgi:pyrroloquinoline quinone (PQQ) biosynthesis protein C